MMPCAQPGCTGTIAEDGYCDTCGAKAPAAPAAPAAVSASAAPSAVAPSGRAPRTGAASSATARTRGSRSTSRRGSARSALGAGLVDVPPTPVGDPAAAVMSDAEIATVLEATPEDQRFCAACAKPVGRGADGRPGRVKGFCGSCRKPFDFTTNSPSLAVGERVAQQYEVVGCLAHGGLGWIYLARDTAVSNRWVVLKGLLNSNDPDAVAAAVAERQYLAQVEHGNIVRIYNFVTWRGAGYIVMEYVGGESLNAKLKARRRANNGTPDPLPVAEAIAYVLAVLPALSHLHRLGLLYNDLKPANIMAIADDVKLIDLGAVIRADDPNAVVFGTVGFQGPEVETDGPTIASDVYTVGRTLAVLVLNFVFHEGAYRFALPSPADEPLFATWESLYRLLLKATATDPRARFADCDELAEQLHAVLREVVARTDGRPRPSTSRLFAADGLPNLFARLGDKLDVTAANWRAVPDPRADPADPATPLLAQLPDVAPDAVLRAIDAAVAEGRVGETVEVRYRRAHALIDAGRDPGPQLDALDASTDGDWRTVWYRALHALASGQGTPAATGFSEVWTELPGEIAPRFALALAAEAVGDIDRAHELYADVASVDDSWVSAMFGMARCATTRDDMVAAVRAFEMVPTTSAVYIDAQLAAARRRVAIAAANGSLEELHHAAATIDRLLLDERTRAEAQAEILEAAITGVSAGGNGAGDAGVTLFGASLTERSLRLELERTYRSLARAATSRSERFRLVDRANSVRPRSVF